jgi:hypothetical protein
VGLSLPLTDFNFGADFGDFGRDLLILVPILVILLTSLGVR